MSIPRRRIDWKLYDRHQGTDADFARSIGLTPGNFAQYKKTRYRDEPTIVDVPIDTITLTPPSNGNLPAIPSAHPSAVQRISALPVHPSALDLDELRARVTTLEAFMAAVQAQQRPNASPRTDSASYRIRVHWSTLGRP